MKVIDEASLNNWNDRIHCLISELHSTLDLHAEKAKENQAFHNES